MCGRGLLRALSTTALVLVLVPCAAAQSLGASSHRQPVPAEVSPAIASALAAEGMSVRVGAQTIEFWWVKALPGATWNALPAGELVGVMRMSAPWREIRGKTVKPGVYMLRYALQPQNGDHLGVSPYREFLLLSPSMTDTQAGAVGHDPAVALSKTSIGGSHPAMISIDPPVTDAAPLAGLTTDDGHQAVVVRIPAASGHITFGVVLIGKIEH